MLKNGIINGQLASALARFRHVNTLAIVDGPFPSYPGVELIDLALIKGFPTIPDVLDAILPLLDLTGLYLANEFSEKVDAKTVASYKKHYENILSNKLIDAQSLLEDKIYEILEDKLTEIKARMALEMFDLDEGNIQKMGYIYPCNH